MVTVAIATEYDDYDAEIYRTAPGADPRGAGRPLGDADAIQR